MEDVTGFFELPIRDGVIAHGSFTEASDAFKEWQTRCTGRTALAQLPPKTENMVSWPKVYIELEEDVFNYKLTFDEIPRLIMLSGESAAYYCPYIPLTKSGALVKQDLDDQS